MERCINRSMRCIPSRLLQLDGRGRRKLRWKSIGIVFDGIGSPLRFGMEVSRLFRKDLGTAAVPLSMGSTKLTRQVFVVKHTLSRQRDHGEGREGTLRFLVRQAAHFFLPLFPHGLLTILLVLERD